MSSVCVVTLVCEHVVVTEVSQVGKARLDPHNSVGPVYITSFQWDYPFAAGKLLTRLLGLWSYCKGAFRLQGLSQA